MLTTRKRRPSDESILQAMLRIRPEMIEMHERYTVEEWYSRTSVFGLRYKVNDQAKTDNVPFVAMLDLGVHQ